MDPAEDECPDQQYRHTPECVEEKGILLGIMMRRMREISRELSVRSFMALLTRFNDVGPAEMGSRIGYPLYVMGTMAVVAFSCFRVS
jgi:hypothetical protein